MTILLSHTTALWTWNSPLARENLRRRQSFPNQQGEGLPRPSSPARARTEAPHLLSCIWDMPREELPPIDILVARGASRRGIPGIRPHTWAETLDQGCISQIDSHLAICSPELVFLQMVEAMDMPGAIFLGSALCGSFFPAQTPEGYVFMSPRTSVDALHAFLEPLGGVRGVAKARCALDRLVVGALTPMQAALALALTLPRTMGGLGLPQANMNQRIRLGRAGQNLCGCTYLYCDLAFPKTPLVVLFGGGPQVARGNDLLARALGADGYHVVCLSPTQLADPEGREKIIHACTKALRIRRRPESGRILTKREELLGALLPFANIAAGLDNPGTGTMGFCPWALPERLAIRPLS